MIKLITILFCVVAFVSVGFSQTPAPTPAGDDGSEWMEYINAFPDREEWVDTNYDPVETRRGFDIRVKDIIVQSVLANAAVICTYGYENNEYDDDSGDIRGLSSQGFIDIEGTVIAFRLEDIFVSNAFAGDKWKKVNAIKIKSYPQTKPSKPKKVKWKKEDGLKEKKEKFDGGGS